MNIDFDHARIGSHPDDIQARIVGRLVAFDLHRLAQLARGVFDRGQQFDPVFKRLGWRHEHAQAPTPPFEGNCGAHRFAVFTQRLLVAVLRRAGTGVAAQAGSACRRSRGGVLRLIVFRIGLGGPIDTDVGAGRQRWPRHARIGRIDIGILRRRYKRQRTERQPVAQCRVTRRGDQAVPTGGPVLTAPARGLGMPALHRQHIANRFRQATFEDARHPGPRFRVFQTRIGRLDVDRQLGFLLQPVRRIFKGRQRMVDRHLEPAGNGLGEGFGTLGLFGVVARHGAGRTGRQCSDQGRILPERLTIGTPVQRECPARQGFARIPLALTVMQRTARRKLVFQAADELIGKIRLARANGVGIPLAAFIVVDRHEGRFAAHGQAHIGRLQFFFNAVAGQQQSLPGLFGKRQRDPRPLGDPVDLHVEIELDHGLTGDTGNRCRAAIVRRGG